MTLKRCEHCRHWKITHYRTDRVLWAPCEMLEESLDVHTWPNDDSVIDNIYSMRTWGCADWERKPLGEYSVWLKYYLIRKLSKELTED